MGIRRSVFGSEPERELFHSISKQWGGRLAVYPGLQFASIIGGIKSLPDLTETQRGYLLSAYVDYTLCTTDEGRPLLSIEFDGLSRGFSRAGRYVAIPAYADPKRTEHLDLKVRVATREGYPLFVVSYHEKNPIGEKTHLTIVDGIIGQVLANKEFRASLDAYAAGHAEEIEAMSPEIRDEHIQSLVVNAEVSAEMEWNPIARDAAKLEFELSKRGIVTGHRWEYLDEPGVPDVPQDLFDPMFIQAMEARIEALRRAVRVGCKVTLNTVFGEVSETAWVRNIDYAGVSPLSLSEDIAMLLACTRATDMANQHGLP